MQTVRQFLDSKSGRAAGAALAVLALAALGWSAWGTLGRSSAASFSANRTFVDAETGRPFSHELRAGETIPVRAPSGGQTGYPAELCYWTADGQIKSKPTAVLMNTYKGSTEKGSTEPTFCPDCGRLVVPHNPRPLPGANPPPTRDEYAQRHPSRVSAPPPTHDER